MISNNFVSSLTSHPRKSNKITEGILVSVELISKMYANNRSVHIVIIMAEVIAFFEMMIQMKMFPVKQASLAKIGKNFFASLLPLREMRFHNQPLP